MSGILEVNLLCSFALCPRIERLLDKNVGLITAKKIYFDHLEVKGGLNK